jgi:hypothetical protein
MPTQLKQVISSFLTWSSYKKLAMSMTWQISPGALTDVDRRVSEIPKSDYYICPPAGLSVRREKHGSQWKDFHEL